MNPATAVSKQHEHQHKARRLRGGGAARVCPTSLCPTPPHVPLLGVNLSPTPPPITSPSPAPAGCAIDPVFPRSLDRIASSA